MSFKYLFFTFLLAATLGCSNAQSSAPESKPFENVDVATFKKLMETEPNAVLLDVRTPGEIAQGKIPGALEIDVKNPEVFNAEIAKLDKSKTYLVYCKVGGRSANACGKMEDLGFPKLYNLEGGFTAWKQAEK